MSSEELLCVCCLLQQNTTSSRVLATAFQNWFANEHTSCGYMASSLEPVASSVVHSLLGEHNLIVANVRILNGQLEFIVNYIHIHYTHSSDELRGARPLFLHSSAAKHLRFVFCLAHCTLGGRNVCKLNNNADMSARTTISKSLQGERR